MQGGQGEMQEPFGIDREGFSEEVALEQKWGGGKG